MADDRLTGKASFINFNGATLYITKYSPKSTKTLVEVTDTGDFDPDSKLLQQTQLAVKVGTEVDVEGYFRRSTTNAAVIGALYDGADAVPVVFGLDAGTMYGHGNFDIGEFSAEVPSEDKVSWKASLKSNGKFVHGS